MRLAVLYSGGKDSTYAAYLMQQQGHEVDLLVSVIPSETHSWMFHTPNLNLLPLMAQAMGKGLVVAESIGEERGDLDALRTALADLDVEGVVTGAIASDYQWDRINGVCQELGLRVFSPLWRKEQGMLIADLIEAGVRAIIVATQAEGLDASWLGRPLDRSALMDLLVLEKLRGVNPSGEGGEYETLVLDSPLHSRPIKVVEAQRRVGRDGARLEVTKARLQGE
jgi:diphthine-ammonia ligase